MLTDVVYCRLSAASAIHSRSTHHTWACTHPCPPTMMRLLYHALGWDSCKFSSLLTSLLFHLGVVDSNRVLIS